MNDSSNTDRHFMDLAARTAARGHGGAEPNPLVGCVLVSPGGEVVGSGFHRRFGGPHAEVNALRAAGDRARGATAYMTLEPCSHTGKTPPCTEALIEAGVSRVVIARRDPNPIAAGGVERLRSVGISVDTMPDFELAVAVTDPFVHRVRSGLPWVTIKWAQTLDGRVATRSGESQWISNVQCRRMVHRERGRTDCILTGIGTVLADDPMLTARGVRVRRIARRLVIDPRLETPASAKLVTTAGEFPTILACGEEALSSKGEHAETLRSAGVELIGVPCDAGELPVAVVLRDLVDRYEVTNVLVEAGAGLIGRLLRQKVAREIWAFIAPLMLGDARAMPCATGITTERLADGVKLTLISSRVRGGDIVLRYRVV